MNRQRRSFLKGGLASVAGAAMLPGCASSQLPPAAAPASGAAEAMPTPSAQPGEAGGTREPPEPKKITRVLGKTGLDVPIVSIGAMAITNPNLLRAALDAGVVHVDTAHVYQNGRNEVMVGEVMADRPRDSCTIATKVVPDGEDRKTGKLTAESKPGPFIEKFETSLKRLRMDYVDILYLHSVVSRDAVLFEPIMQAMVKLKEEGKARYIGVSTHRNEPEVLRAAAEGGVHDVVLAAYNFRQPHVAEVEAAMKVAAEAGIGIVAMKTQAGVFYDRERTKPINMKAALKWALRNPHVHTSIPGVTSFDQLELDLSVMTDLEMTPEEKADLATGQEQAGLFCHQCGTCVEQCARDLDIPTIMRSYMYAYGYRNPAVARETLDSIALAPSPCADCASCTVTGCERSFDIRARVTDIARLRRVPSEFLT